jgi:hypothetical protein
VLTVRTESFEAAGALSGALTGPVFGHIHMLLRGSHRDRCEQAMASLAATLGPDAYGKAQRHGAGMNYDEIIGFTRSQLAAPCRHQLEPATTQD